MRLISIIGSGPRRPTRRGSRTQRSPANRYLRIEPLEDRRVLSVGLTPLGTYDTGIFDESAAEIVAYDSQTERLFVTNSAELTIDALDLDESGNMTLDFQIDVSALGNPTSVAVYDDLVAVSIVPDPHTNPGRVAFFRTDGTPILDDSQEPIVLDVGYNPDMITFTPDGTMALTADEGQPTNTDYEPEDGIFLDPEGSVSIIAIPENEGTLSQDDVTKAGFQAFDRMEDELRASGVRIFGPGATVAEDLEPEYLAVSEDSTTAWVTLQENNAIAILDLTVEDLADAVVSIEALGYKDNLLPGNGFDASNKDDGVNIQAWPVKSMYQPDAIATYTVDGNVYLVTANEGDARDFGEARVKDLLLGGPAFAHFGRKDLQANENLGRLKVTTEFPSDQRGNNGCYHEVYAYGTRSFSIWTAGGELVFDSGDDFEQITAAALEDVGGFNSNNDENDSFDARSDDKGPEPEYVVLGQIGVNTYAFVGLERVGGIMVYDVTDPMNPSFESYVNPRDFNPELAPEDAGDLGPEGLKFIPGEKSPTGEPLLVVANEVSGTTTVLAVRELDSSTGQATAFTNADWSFVAEQIHGKKESKNRGPSKNGVDSLLALGLL